MIKMHGSFQLLGIFGALAIHASSLSAQNIGSFAECHAEAGKFRRLDCYDRVTGFLPRDVAEDVEQAPSPTSSAQDEATEARLVQRFSVAVGALNFESAKGVLTAEVLNSLSEEARTQMEEALLEEVRPLPASQLQANLDGYLLLVALRPEDEAYRSKVEQYTDSIAAQKNEALQRLEQERDDFRNITFHHHRNEPEYIDTRSRIGLYIAEPDDGRPILRVKTVYTEDTWLFVDSAEVSIDGQVSNFTSGEFQRDNDSDIWEWRDEVPSSSQLNLLRQMAEAERVVVRFNGQQYYDDKDLSNADKQMIRDVLLAYDQMSAEH